MKKHLPIVPVITFGAAMAVGCSRDAEPAAPTQVAADETLAADEAPAAAGEPTAAAPPPERQICGPQSPRDLSVAEGTNLAQVPAGETPHLCNVHFHVPFEHAGFTSVPAVADAGGDPVCQSVEVGDQVEFHWVYTSCEPKDELVKGLDNCVCDRDDMVLRVHAQAYVVGDTGVAPDQPEGDLVRYAGSTTGPAYDAQTCSPARVNWVVDREVEVLGKDALGAWCQTNPWIGEDQPHEARALVTDPTQLSPI